MNDMNMDDQPPTTTTLPPYSPEPVPPRHRRRRTVLAAGITGGLVAVAAGVSGGYALGLQHEQAQPQAGSSASGPTNIGFDPGKFLHGGLSLPGGGHWVRIRHGVVPVPTEPFGSSAPAPGSSRATSSQVVGLTRVLATQKYAGGKAAGTGIVLSPDGEVVTNNHVVEGSTSIKVTDVATGTTYRARVVGTDPTDDVAVLQLVGAHHLATAPLSTTPATAGDQVTAVGDAEGVVSHLTAARGKVVGVGRSITTQAEASVLSEHLHGLIQITSAVRPGDSGGATEDSAGQVLGMTVAASATPGSREGFAIPMSSVTRIAGQIEHRVQAAGLIYSRPAFLGVGLAPQQRSAVVKEVIPSTAAAAAGVTVGSRITQVGATPVSSAATLHAAMAQHSPGQRLDLGWVDPNGASHHAELTLGSGGIA